jgi:purine catabolism regulator
VSPTLGALLAQRSLKLTAVVMAGAADLQVRWIHSSDLVDPTPFLEPGHVLLTTGTQFPLDATTTDFDDYVARLHRCGIVAIGFGTEITRTGTPAELAASCAARGIALFEVPYDTPFIAVIRWVADTIATEARARDDWSLSAQRAISLAALGERGLPGALAALASQLRCRVAVLDRGGTYDDSLSPDTFTGSELKALTAEAAHLLRRGRRSASQIELSGTRAQLQTLGQRGRLSGVLAIVGAVEQDTATAAVITSAVALTEVSLEQNRTRRLSALPVHRELFALALAGRPELIDLAAPGLGSGPARLILCQPDEDRSVESLAEAIEHHSAVRQLHVFLAPHAEMLAVLVPNDEFGELADYLVTSNIPSGASGETPLTGLPEAVDQGRVALARSRRRGGELVEFSQLDDAEFFEILHGPGLTGFAASRLASIRHTPDGAELLTAASVWLSHNGLWEPAARELGVHRHVLRARMRHLGHALGLDIDDFADRVQLWIILSAAPGKKATPGAGNSVRPRTAGPGSASTFDRGPRM